MQFVGYEISQLSLFHVFISFSFLLSEVQPRHQWSKEEDTAIQQFFAEEISDVSQPGNKGTLISKTYSDTGSAQIRLLYKVAKWLPTLKAGAQV